MTKNCTDLHKHKRGFFRLIILLLLSAAGVFGFLAWRGLSTIRWGMSECLKWQAASLSDRFFIQDKQFKELEAMLQEFAQKIESGNVSPQRGFEILRALYKGPVMLALLHTSIVNNVHSSEFPDNTDLKSIEKTSRQFFISMKLGKVPIKVWENIKNMLMEEKICETETSIGFIVPERIEIFRKKIGFKAMFDCLAKMNHASKLAQAISQEDKLDPVIELRKVLNKD